MAYDEIVTTRKRQTSITQHLIGQQESFHLDQFLEGQVYMKEIKFGSKQSKNDILGFEAVAKDGEGSQFGGTLLVKVQLLRDEEDMLDEVITNCTQKVIAIQEYSQYLQSQLV